MQYQSISLVVLFIAAMAVVARFGYIMSAALRGEREQRELLDMTLRNISEGVIAADIDGRVTMISPEALRITGWTEKEALHHPIDDVLKLIDAETLAPAPSPMQRVRGKHASASPLPTALVRKNGTVRDIDDIAAPIIDARDNIVGCLVVFRDATETRRLHRMIAHQLQASRLCGSIIESSNDAILSNTIDGIIDSWNGAAESLFGYTAAEMIGQHISLLIPRELQDEEAQIARKVQSGQKVAHAVTQRLCADGRRVFVSLTVSPIRNNDAQIIGASTIARDVTGQLQADRRERELLAESSRLAEELKLAERRKNDTVGVLAEELLNPLAPIVTAAHLVQQDPANASAVGAAAEIMIRQAETMRLLIDDLVDVTRVRQGQIQLAKDRVDVGVLIEDAAEAVRRTNCKALLIVTTPSHPVHVTADPVRLAQIVGNLLNNACQFTSDKDEIHVSVGRDQHGVTITVRDTGIGIAPENLPRVFQMYSRFERKSPRSPGGLGIGLALVRSLVDLHGGSIVAESRGLGHGATFSVHLPA